MIDNCVTCWNHGVIREEYISTVVLQLHYLSEHVKLGFLSYASSFLSQTILFLYVYWWHIQHCHVHSLVSDESFVQIHLNLSFHVGNL